MNRYTIKFKNIVTYMVDIEAETEEKALDKFYEGDFCWEYAEERDSEGYDGPDVTYVEEDINQK